MKKSIVIHILVIVIAAAAGSMIASTLVNDQSKTCVNRNKTASKAVFGFNKFIADVQWMLFINYCGSIDSIKDQNVDEVYNKLAAILKNDPDFQKAYEIGALMISIKASDKAVELLKQGTDNPRLSTNWKIPFLAGFVMNHNVPKDKLSALVSKIKADSYWFFEAAAKRSSPPEPHVISSLMRAKAEKLLNKKWKENITIVNEKQALLCAWLDEALNATKVRMGVEDLGYSFIASSVKDMNQKILQQAANLKKNYPDNQNILNTIAYMKSNYLKGQNFCDVCLAVYAPGDKFCSSCGHKVIVFGVCADCGAVKKGAHCSACGAPKDEAAAPAKAAETK
ncbi:MAG: zinc ribbon domain-containing protein [Victivallales bacterium]